MLVITSMVDRVTDPPPNASSLSSLEFWTLPLVLMVTAGTVGNPKDYSIPCSLVSLGSFPCSTYFNFLFCT